MGLARAIAVWVLCCCGLMVGDFGTVLVFVLYWLIGGGFDLVC